MKGAAARCALGLVALAALLAAGAAVGARGEGSDVQAATTGNHSELVRKIEIRGNPKGFTTVMKLKDSQMPSFERGDELRVSAELAVTTDCTEQERRCAGKPYTYDPRIDTKLVLSSSQGKVKLGSDETRCVQKPSDRQHHCIIPFHGIKAGNAATRLGCDVRGCRIEYLARAHNSQANSGQFLIIGGQQETGKLTGDKGRINVIRLRGEPEVRSFQTKLQQKEVPAEVRKEVIISRKLEGLERGDVIEGWVDIKAEVGHLPYAALVGSEILLAEKPDAIHGKEFVKRVSELAGELTENAGTNCTQAQTPCPVFRTGVLTMQADAVSNGRPQPLYLNVVIRTKNKQSDARPGDKVRFKDEGGLRVRVYERR